MIIDILVSLAAAGLGSYVGVRMASSNVERKRRYNPRCHDCVGYGATCDLCATRPIGTEAGVNGDGGGERC